MTTKTISGQSSAIESLDDLLIYFKAAEKPREDWRIGTEHEKIGFYRQTRLPIPFQGEDGIRAILEAFADRFGWIPVREGGNIIALLRGRASITLEPGGQLELSGAPFLTVHDTCRELKQHLDELRQISEEMGIIWMTLGRNPITPTDQMPWMPKERYKIMKKYMAGRGSMAFEMMLGTGTVQTNLDYSSEEDMARKLRVTTSIAPFLTALFANSPFAEGKPTGYLSTRALVWLHTDPERCGIIPAVLKKEMGYQDYIDFALAAPMFFIQREGKFLDYSGRSFKRFIEEGLDGHRTTQEDWVLHLSTVFPEVRLKNIIELRMADVGPGPIICSLPALTRGLLYDDTAIGELETLISEIPISTFPLLSNETARDGLRAVVQGRPVREWARDILDIAAAGLERLDGRDDQGENEVKYLQPLRQIVDTGKTQADLLLELWRGEWNENLDHLFQNDFIL